MKKMLLMIAAIMAIGAAKAYDRPFHNFRQFGDSLSNYDTYTQLESAAQNEARDLYRWEVSMWGAEMTALRSDIHTYAIISAGTHGLSGDKKNWDAYKLLQDIVGLIEENGGTMQ
jgi:hypothetical protein